jgi:hypothetical protein
LVEVDGLVVDHRVRRVLVLRPPRITDVTADQTDELIFAISDGDEHALAVEIRNTPVRIAIYQTCVDQLVGREACG